MTDTVIGLWEHCMIGRDMPQKKPAMESGNTFAILLDA